MLKAGLVKEYETNSCKETKALGEKLGSLLEPGDLICLLGDLGAGKTTFLKGLIPSVTESCDEFEVKSPTFLTLQYYEGKINVAHFDLYRLSDAEAFFDQGFEEYINNKIVTCIEWSEKIKEHLPKNAIFISFFEKEENKRVITIKKGQKSG